MNLFINSPSYYTREYGVIDEIYTFCNCISKNIDITKYTNSLDTIGIVPMIAPQDVITKLEWKPRKYVSLRYRMADISLPSNFKEYHNGDLERKKQIILENIMSSMQAVKRKLKSDFDYERFEKDIEELIHL